MIERLMRFLRDLPGTSDTDTTSGLDEVRVAATALMFHIIDADGVRGQDEHDRLEAVLTREYGLSEAELQALLKAGEEADRDAVDLYTFTSVLARALDGEGKRDFLRGLWEMVFADGEMHELEDNIVWRVAELIGVDSRDRVELRRSVAAEKLSGGAVERE